MRGKGRGPRGSGTDKRYGETGFAPEPAPRKRPSARTGDSSGWSTRDSSIDAQPKEQEEVRSRPEVQRLPKDRSIQMPAERTVKERTLRRLGVEKRGAGAVFVARRPSWSWTARWARTIPDYLRPRSKSSIQSLPRIAFPAGTLSIRTTRRRESGAVVKVPSTCF